MKTKSKSKSTKSNKGVTALKTIIKLAQSIRRKAPTKKLTNCIK